MSRTAFAEVTREGKKWSLPVGLFIKNEFVPSMSGKTFPTIDPSNGEVIVEVFEAGKTDVEIAVSAAREALEEWRKLPAGERGKCLWKIADVIEQHAPELAEIESWDNGKTIKDAMGDVQAVVDVYRYFAGWTDKITGQVLDFDPSLQTYTRAEPLGVIGQIIPWNYPLMMQAWKLAPALACGNTVVMKTSEKTPLSALKVCELLASTSIPPGVVNILSGFGTPCGEAIARHPDIDKIAFTGSTSVGRKIMVMAAESNLKKVTLELGGKSPNIVFDDADVDKAVVNCYGGIFDNMGQNCCAGSRIFVQEGIYDNFLEKFRKQMSENSLGDPRDPKTTMGPLVDSLQFASVQKFINLGKEEGATLAYGGNRHGTKGFFMQPALFTDVSPDMKIYKEEIFGPVACLVKFKTEEEVLRLANGTEFGLAAAIHTKDLGRAVRMEKQIKAGVVWINTYNLTPPQMPFGGFKQSGIGRELGEYGLREYTQMKSVVMSLD